MLSMHSVDFLPNYCRDEMITLETSNPIQFACITQQERETYAAFQPFAQQCVGEVCFSYIGKGQWQYCPSQKHQDHPQWLHAVMVAPTWMLIEKVYSELSELSEFDGFFIHPQSDFASAAIGLVFPIINLKCAQLKIELLRVSELLGVDIVCTENMPVLSQPGLLVMDMDSTVIACECIDEIAKLAGVGDAVSEVTERAMRGELDFAESLRSRVACLQGLPVDTLSSIRQRLPLMPGLIRLVAQLQAMNWRIAIASGGFTFFAEHLQHRLGLDAAVANQLAVEDALLTGHVSGSIVDAQVKAETVQQLSQHFQIAQSQTVAMGDGANDLAMMNVAALGVAYKAKPVVEEQADVAIRFTGLDTLLLYLRY
ncbi:phosphoserine phosphatase SerB [Alteromonas flava]|uniref:phosphoserine phosphatase SerB n=1 Tax=Alteromonas flava TaxID=2048003 RepID=UPI001F0CC914|nr:phosphoserine phosphatase SerB [Alteromonas flava]